MKIKLISFSESKLVSMNATHGALIDKVEEITGLEEKFLFCQTQKDMFAGVKEGIENADVIILAVDVSRFISTKAALFRALGFKCRLNSEITNLINSDLCMATLNENQVNAHAAIPVGGEAFITNDGLFSGFGIESGKQKLIFVPIDEKRIGAIFENGMIAFLSKGVEKATQQEESADSDIPEEMEGYVEPIENFEEPGEDTEPEYEEIYRAPEEESAEETEEEEVTEETEEPAFEDINSSSLTEEIYSAEQENIPERENAPYNAFSRSLAVLSSRGVKIAFVRQIANEVYTELLSGIGSSPAVQFVNVALEGSPEDDMKRKELAALNAKNALNKTGADFAVAMTEIYHSEDGAEYIFATLSDSNKSSVFKIFSSEDEGVEELYKAGLEGIFDKIEEKTMNFVPEENEEPEMGQVKKPASKGSVTPATQIIIWALVIVALCALSALIIDTVMSGNASLAEMSGAIISDVNNLLLR